ncbi:hypothetical protein [Nitrospirillum amazonense]|uniref:Uncharacterized protein n=1 Tax=Nitrospirillum amazonense TaxID=28077 RepID=A0A560K4N1_9PROT|nr:hypothetical protein [Nitrospirillum amazonense]MDG3440095.1 hypothetical protein [Nitrospirillum amazonense]TWB75580.1 hypothetical protein FBZ87_104691 [Nitrospirillum amazonense]
MSIGGINFYSSGYGATFLTSGVGSTSDVSNSQVQSISPVKTQGTSDQGTDQANTDNNASNSSSNSFTQNFSPTQDQVKAASDTGRTRGAFVNLTV